MKMVNVTVPANNVYIKSSVNVLTKSMFSDYYNFLHAPSCCIHRILQDMNPNSCSLECNYHQPIIKYSLIIHSGSVDWSAAQCSGYICSEAVSFLFFLPHQSRRIQQRCGSGQDLELTVWLNSSKTRKENTCLNKAQTRAHCMMDQDPDEMQYFRRI